MARALHAVQSSGAPVRRRQPEEKGTSKAKPWNTNPGFKLAARRAAKKKMCEEDKKLLKVCTHRGYALERLGISNHAAMVASVVKVSREAQRHLDREL